MYEIEAIETPSLLTAVVRRRFSRDNRERRSWIADGHGIVAAHLQTIGVPTAGIPFARVHHLGDRELEVEAGIPVTERITPKDEIGPSELPAGPAFATWHQQHPDEADEAYEAIAAWMERQGVEAVDSPWENYHRNPLTDASAESWLVEIVQPYRP